MQSRLPVELHRDRHAYFVYPRNGTVTTPFSYYKYMDGAKAYIYILPRLIGVGGSLASAIRYGAVNFTTPTNLVVYAKEIRSN